MKHLFSLKNDFFFFEILPVSFLIAVPTHFCYFFGARKQRNKNEKRKKSECNKSESGQYLFP